MKGLFKPFAKSVTCEKDAEDDIEAFTRDRPSNESKGSGSQDSTSVLGESFVDLDEYTFFLADDVLVEIFLYLELKPIVLTASLVCKQFYAASVGNSLWIQLLARYFGKAFAGSLEIVNKKRRFCQNVYFKTVKDLTKVLPKIKMGTKKYRKVQGVKIYVTMLLDAFEVCKKKNVHIFNPVIAKLISECNTPMANTGWRSQHAAQSYLFQQVVTYERVYNQNEQCTEMCRKVLRILYREMASHLEFFKKAVVNPMNVFKFFVKPEKPDPRGEALGIMAFDDVKKILEGDIMYMLRLFSNYSSVSSMNQYSNILPSSEIVKFQRWILKTILMEKDFEFLADNFFRNSNLNFLWKELTISKRENDIELLNRMWEFLEHLIKAEKLCLMIGLGKTLSKEYPYNNTVNLTYLFSNQISILNDNLNVKSLFVGLMKKELLKDPPTSWKEEKKNNHFPMKLCLSGGLLTYLHNMFLENFLTILSEKEKQEVMMILVNNKRFWRSLTGFAHVMKFVDCCKSMKEVPLKFELSLLEKLQTERKSLVTFQGIMSLSERLKHPESHKMSRSFLKNDPSHFLKTNFDVVKVINRYPDLKDFVYDFVMSSEEIFGKIYATVYDLLDLTNLDEKWRSKVIERVISNKKNLKRIFVQGSGHGQKPGVGRDKNNHLYCFLNQFPQYYEEIKTIAKRDKELLNCFQNADLFLQFSSE